MPEREFKYRISVEDDGSVVVKTFAATTERASEAAAAAMRGASTRMSRAFARVRSAAGRVGGAFKGLFRAATSLKGLFLTGLGAFVLQRAFRAVISAAQRQEDAVKSLNAALQASGQFSEAVSLATQDYAAALQRQTRFGDEAIIQAQALLVTYGVTIDKLAEATELTLDYAAATGKDLRVAAETVGKAASGMVGELANLGVTVERDTPKSEAFSAVLAQLRERVGGRAQEDVRTFSGRIDQAAGAFGDLQEKIGESITRSVKLGDRIKGLTDALFGATDATGKLIGTKIGDFLAQMIPTTDRLISVFFGVARAVVEVVNFINRLRTVGIVVFNALKIAVLFLSEAFLAWQQNMVGVFEFLRRGVVNIIETISSSFSKLINTLSIAADVLGMEDLAAGLRKADLDLLKLTLRVRDFGDTSGYLKQVSEDAARVQDERATATRALNDALDEQAGRERQLAETLQNLGIVETEVRGRLAEARANEVTQFAATEAKKIALAETAATAQQKADVDVAKTAKEVSMSRLESSQALFTGLAQLAATGGQASFAAFKAFAVGEAVVAGALAVQKALASSPPPFSFAIAATTAAMTALNVAKILAARPGGGAGAGAVAPAGGGPPAPVAPPPTAPVAAAAPAPAGMAINVSVAGFVGNETTLASELGRVIREAVGDGVDFGLEVSR